tara:strand:+ start:476 stop:760 length:285 start_codon:yes stop_codon:yes gene_type:complete
MGYKQPGFSKHATKDEIKKTKIATTSVKKPIIPNELPANIKVMNKHPWADDPIRKHFPDQYKNEPKRKKLKRKVNAADKGVPKKNKRILRNKNE